MKQPNYYKINTLVRVHEINLLSAKQKKDLLHAPDFSSALHMLREWGTFSFADTDSFDDIAQVLSSEKLGWISWTKEIDPDLEVADIFLLADTIHNFKVFLKERVTGRSLDQLYVNTSIYHTVDFQRLLDHAEGQSIVPLHWKEQANCAIEEYGQHHSLAAIDYRLDAFYYAELMRMTAELDDDDVNDLVAVMVDSYHLSILLQTRGTNRDIPSVAIVSGGHLKDSLPDLLRMDPHEQDVVLQKSIYASLWHHLKRAESTGMFEQEMDNYIMTICKKAKFQIFGIFPLYAFLHAKMSDLKNIRLILSGKRQLLPASEIEKRVCITYEL